MECMQTFKSSSQDARHSKGQEFEFLFQRAVHAVSILLDPRDEETGVAAFSELLRCSTDLLAVRGIDTQHASLQRR